MSDDLTPGDQESRHGPPSRKEWIIAWVVVVIVALLYFLSRFGMM